MLMETDMQARFIIPMAISLGFGILFATTITLILVPSAYVILEDLRMAGRWLIGKDRGSSLPGVEDVTISTVSSDDLVNRT